MNLKAVIFDLDGTLLDTLDDLADSMNYVLSSNGFQIHDKSKYKYFVGDGMRNLVKRSLPEGNFEEKAIDTYFNQMREQYSKNWAVKSKPYSGISELLDALDAKNFPKAVLSNKAHDFTVQVVKELLSNWQFTYVYGEREGITRKPDPSGALEIAKKLGLKPEEIIYVGDTSTDMKTAVNAGMFPVGVLWGFREKEELIEHGAKLIISDPLELLKLI